MSDRPSDTPSSIKAIPEWAKCKRVVLVHPKGLYKRGQLSKVYDELIHQLSQYIDLFLLVKDEKVRDDVVKKFTSPKVETVILTEVSDIWIRDWAPISVRPGDKICSVKLLYDPTYYKAGDRKYAEADHAAGLKLTTLIEHPLLIDAEIKWDMGNLTHNGTGTAIVSNRLISDNESHSIDELQSLLNSFCGFNKVIFVPVEYGDTTGHVDGMIRFISEQVIAVSSYHGQNSLSYFMDRMANSLARELGSEFKILRIANALPEDFESEGISSAVGNHTNFLRIEDKIFFPYYGDEISAEPLASFREQLKAARLDIELVPTSFPGIIDIARLGGVLNCVSWQAFA